ncbi:hypothetical protein FRC01_013073 [Tulasnella sp. 417]|nr:hypothetical protein FRC01_013073 [Tulasnella sp. 417]
MAICFPGSASNNGSVLQPLASSTQRSFATKSQLDMFMQVHGSPRSLHPPRWRLRPERRHYTVTAENNPALTLYKCITSSAALPRPVKWCSTPAGAGSTLPPAPPTGNVWNTSLCPNNDALDGADYSNTYVRHSQQQRQERRIPPRDSRVYLMKDDTIYEMFKVLNQEFTFDVDVSKLLCGLNGAVCFSKMHADGGLAATPTNKAGGKYRTGYCDAQCPV